ncbi:hypothetical protein SAMN05216198_1312 [Halopseudomonas litoralis]|uniref:Lipoprotein-attachment site-containing protein n=1 Tax=Halopseudomonas litoralis TaxID=797277 RepID=A0A1H1PX35_9GAMM|nr:hypothetical protein [Halopseudomonas litoralis]SDS15768.1 hypothetical protein SAMN05216198_1312 [Halopseudomonas litoralis]
MRLTYLLVPAFALMLAGCGPDENDRINEEDAMPPSAEPQNNMGQPATGASGTDMNTPPATSPGTAP